jgi:hypothetical protein
LDKALSVVNKQVSSKLSCTENSFFLEHKKRMGQVLYGESCAVLHHNCLYIKAFLLSWNSPFKKLSSSHKIVYVCLTMYSPLKEIYNFNKYVNTLRVKMAKRVQKTKKSPEDYQEQEATRDMKIQKTMKDQEIKRPRTPARVRESARVKEGCQVSRIQNPKSLEDWHITKVRT